MLRIAIQAEGFQRFVCVVQDGAAGGFVYAAALHADQAVFHNVYQADAVGAAQFVELLRMISLADIFCPSSATGTPFSNERVM